MLLEFCDRLPTGCERNAAISWLLRSLMVCPLKGAEAMIAVVELRQRLQPDSRPRNGRLRTMNDSLIQRICKKGADLGFLALLVASLALAVGGVSAERQRREVLLQQGGARKVDVAKIRQQISDGNLSPRKALFFRRMAP